MSKLAIIAAGLVLLAILAFLMSPALAWDGSSKVEVRFHVRESRKGPIKGAKVLVVRESQLYMLSDTNLSEALPPIITDAHGLAVVQIMCPAGGGSGLLGKRGQFRFEHDLSIEAQGYRTLSTPLANVMGGVRWPLSKKVFDVELLLYKNP